MENKNGDKLSPRLTPKEHSKASLNLFPSLTLDLTAQYMDLIIFKMFPLCGMYFMWYVLYVVCILYGMYSCDMYFMWYVLM